MFRVNMDFNAYLLEKRSLVEQSMTDLLTEPSGLQPDLARHHESISYSLFAGGKRVRPILCLAACEALGKSGEFALPVAVALECIHTYSLIHDDLPSMDDDDLRRGKPTNHIIYGEAGAILAGDSLLTMAFELLSRDLATNLEPTAIIKVINSIANAAGSLGMVGGQAIDIACERKDVDIATLSQIHRLKTGALITASVQSGAIIGGADDDQFESLTKYGERIGLAFQIKDDLLNVEGTTDQLGKAAGSDAERCKATYPGFFGTEGTRKMLENTIEEALDSLKNFDDSCEPLRQLALYIKNRNK